MDETKHGLIQGDVSTTLEHCDWALAFIQGAAVALQYEGGGLTLDHQNISGMHSLIGSVRDAIGHAAAIALQADLPDLKSVGGNNG